MAFYDILDEQEIIDTHYFAKKFYDPSVHIDFDSIEDFEHSILFEKT